MSTENRDIDSQPAESGVRDDDQVVREGQSNEVSLPFSKIPLPDGSKSESRRRPGRPREHDERLVAVTFSITPSLAEWFDAEAEQQGVSRSALARQVLEEFRRTRKPESDPIRAH